MKITKDIKNIIRFYIIWFLALLGLALLIGRANASSYLFPYQGGTGTSTAPQSGQVLIGNSSSTYSPAWITAGSNITISTSSGAITITGSASGITSLNGLTTSTQTFATGTTGTDFNIVSSGSTHTFNIPTASASNRGLLSSTDWTTFNGKQNALTLPLSLSNGGTGANSTSAGIPQSNGTLYSYLAPTVTGQLLMASSTSWVVGNLVAGSNITITTSTPGTITIASTGGGTPAGSSTDVQFNNNGAFGGDDNFQYVTSSSPTQKSLELNSTSSRLLIGGPSSSFKGAVGTNYSFSYTGATTSWTVPQGVDSITITAVGGGGGASSASGSSYSYGGTATGTLAVTGGEVLYIAVGQVGGNGAVGVKGSGGWPNGGNAGTTGGSYNGAGGGGGMSWVSTSTTFSTSTVLLVAGAGGGAGYSTISGGGGGGLTGVAGINNSSITGGGGGTQTAGGTGGTGISPGTNDGTSGSAGVGGTGGPESVTSGYGGGGGGSGYFGGGGGGGGSASNVGGGGGGGSSYLNPVLTSTSTTSGTTSTTPSSNGSVTITIAGSNILSSTNWTLAVGGHIITGSTSSTLPSVSSCGTSPSNDGNDTTGIITTGTGTVNSCTMNFVLNFTNPPVCTATTQTSTAWAYISSASTSSITFGFSASMPSAKFNYTCIGY